MLRSVGPARNLDVRKLSAAPIRGPESGCADARRQDRPGLRFSPHFYNTHADIDRTGGGREEIHVHGGV